MTLYYVAATTLSLLSTATLAVSCSTPHAPPGRHRAPERPHQGEHITTRLVLRAALFLAPAWDLWLRPRPLIGA